MVAVLPPPLFLPGDADDPAYRNLRDEVSEPARIGRKFAEELWAQYFPYADAHYLTEIRRDFNARFWEMYLTCTFLQNAHRYAFTVRCPKPGPDILLEFPDCRVWVEAVAATDGDRRNPIARRTLAASLRNMAASQTIRS
jgi:hypothetical protein